MARSFIHDAPSLSVNNGAIKKSELLDAEQEQPDKHPGNSTTINEFAKATSKNYAAALGANTPLADDNSEPQAGGLEGKLKSQQSPKEHPAEIQMKNACYR